jgi:hypothetical protein
MCISYMLGDAGPGDRLARVHHTMRRNLLDR